MKKILILFIVLAVVALGWFFLRHHDAAAAGAAAEAPAAKVETVVLAEEPIAQAIEVFGVVAAAPSGDRVTAAPYDCLVQSIQVGVGSTVAAGDVLMEIGPTPDTKLALASARSVAALAAQSFAATQERYDLKLATNQDLLTARQAAEDAKLKVDSFAARGLGGDGKIVAAAAGVVTKVDGFVGALTMQGTPLVTVSSEGKFEARLGVEAADVAAIAAGQPVVLESSNRAEAPKISATVGSVGAALDATTGAAEVRVAVPPGAALFLGEHVRAEIEIKKKDHALVVPRSAVLPDDDKQVLFTVKDGKAVKHEVKTGLMTDELVEVMGDGLHAGDVVVSLGNYELEDGMAVQLPEKKTDAKQPEAQEAKP
ncbi:MAG: efflux RND transporter periplasmic adaptor subunit [Opitutaceae bacterium]